MSDPTTVPATTMTNTLATLEAAYEKGVQRVAKGLERESPATPEEMHQRCNVAAHLAKLIERHHDVAKASALAEREQLANDKLKLEVEQSRLAQEKAKELIEKVMAEKAPELLERLRNGGSRA